MYNINIIMSVYNGEKFLREQIESIINSTVSNWKLYIFDDCSTDSSVSIAEEYASKYKSKIFSVKNHRNMGSTLSFLYNLNRVAKKNRENPRLNILNCYRRKERKPIMLRLRSIKNLKSQAIKFVKKPERTNVPIKCAQYYMFCDQDDFWLMDKIHHTVNKLRSVERMKGKHKPCMVYTDAILVDEELKFLEKSFFKTNHMKPGKCDMSHILMENRAIGCTVALNQAAADMLSITYPSLENSFRFRNDYDYVRFHDWWMALICSAFGAVRYYNVPTVMYRQHSANQVGQTDFKTYVKKRASSSDDIKRRINETIAQAECFYRCYGFLLKKRKLKVLKHFIKLKEYNPVVKRLMLFRYGFFKSGFVRNVALLFSI